MEGSVEEMPIYCVSSLFSLPFVATALPWILLGWVAYCYLKPLSIKTHTTFLHEVSPGATPAHRHLSDDEFPSLPILSHSHALMQARPL